MKKYYLVGKGIIDEILIDRVNFLIWRVRVVISVLISYFLWSALLTKQKEISGYNDTLLITYILFSALVASLVLNSRSFSIGDDINQGNLSNYLLKPYNYFLALFSSDIAEKIMNVLFAIFELGIIFAILKPPFYFQQDFVTLLFTVVAILLAVLLYFFFGLLLGAIGFWSSDVWAPRFIFGIILTILSGTMFPMDMLPQPIFLLAQFSPFTYLIYFPAKIYLGNLSLEAILMGLSIATVWVGILYILLQKVWKKGLYTYTAHGR